MHWLLSEEAALEVARAKRSGIAPTSEQLTAFRIQGPGATVASSDGGNPILVTAGNVAEIRIDGVLTEESDFLMWIFGIANTAYSSIRAALAQADSDPAIKSAVLRINSPGGTVDGYFETLAAIQAFKKPLSVMAMKACSGAYGIAAMAGKITAVNAAASFGSIGVAMSIRVEEDVVDITSTEAPEKRPDVTTEEGKAVVVKYLDATHELFAEAIADGRGTTVDKVNAEFGRGSTLLAGEAKKRGMIDGIAKPQLRSVSSRVAVESNQEPSQLVAVGDVQTSADATSDPAKTERKPMDLKTLRAQHPELCAELATEAATNAVTQERDRVGAHLVAGEQSGDMKTALSAIKDGSLMTQTLMSQYLMAGMNRNDRSARQSESDAAGTVVDGATPPAAVSATTDVGDAAAALMAERRGKKLGAANG